LRVSQDQQRVSKRIRPRKHREKAERGKQMSAGQQQTIAGCATQIPDERYQLKGSQKGHTAPEDRPPVIAARPDDECRLDRGKLRGGEQRHRAHGSASRLCRGLFRFAKTVRIPHEIGCPQDSVRRDANARKRAHVRKLYPVTLSGDGSQELSCCESPVRGGIERRCECRLELCCGRYVSQIDRYRGLPRLFGQVEGTHAARITDHQRRQRHGCNRGQSKLMSARCL
jgi:hypothetical protein